MSAAEVRVRAARLADALAEADPHAIRAAMHGLTAQEANRVAREAAAMNGGRLVIG